MYCETNPFSSSPFSISPQILIYSGLLLVGLLLSVDSVLSPLWASLTHHLPSTANLVGEENTSAVTDNQNLLLSSPSLPPPFFLSLLSLFSPSSLLPLSLPLPLLSFLSPSHSLFSLSSLPPTATVLAVVGVFLSHGLALAHPREKAALLGYLPPALFVMTMLLTILQPEFNLKEVCVCPKRSRAKWKDIWYCHVACGSRHTHCDLYIETTCFSRPKEKEKGGGRRRREGEKKGKEGRERRMEGGGRCRCSVNVDSCYSRSCS